MWLGGSDIFLKRTWEYPERKKQREGSAISILQFSLRTFHIFAHHYQLMIVLHRFLFTVTYDLLYMHTHTAPSEQFEDSFFLLWNSHKSEKLTPHTPTYLACILFNFVSCLQGVCYTHTHANTSKNIFFFLSSEYVYIFRSYHFHTVQWLTCRCLFLFKSSGSIFMKRYT